MRIGSPRIPQIGFILDGAHVATEAVERRVHHVGPQPFVRQVANDDVSVSLELLEFVRRKTMPETIPAV
ncbi:unnamed protein product [marine sediment metagenome]|uniref:Uncharacterized protein n=1 Tax=marine sediment metagenome TaxID=412755 RepID=X0V2H2_9ZZZZ